MGYKVDAQTKESEYVKAVHRYVIIKGKQILYQMCQINIERLKSHFLKYIYLDLKDLLN